MALSWPQPAHRAACIQVSTGSGIQGQSGQGAAQECGGTQGSRERPGLCSKEVIPPDCGPDNQERNFTQPVGRERVVTRVQSRVGCEAGTHEVISEDWTGEENGHP